MHMRNEYFGEPKIRQKSYINCPICGEYMPVSVGYIMEHLRKEQDAAIEKDTNEIKLTFRKAAQEMILTLKEIGIESSDADAIFDAD